MIHLDESRRDEALMAAWLSTSSRASWSFGEFLAAIEGWSVHPVLVDARIAGAILTNGAEIHACVLPEFRGLWMSKKTLRILKDVVKEHGFAVTSATTREGVEFVERLGFVFDGQRHILR